MESYPRPQSPRHQSLHRVSASGGKGSKNIGDVLHLLHAKDFDGFHASIRRYGLN